MAVYTAKAMKGTNREQPKHPHHEKSVPLGTNRVQPSWGSSAPQYLNSLTKPQPTQVQALFRTMGWDFYLGEKTTFDTDKELAIDCLSVQMDVRNLLINNLLPILSDKCNFLCFSTMPPTNSEFIDKWSLWHCHTWNLMWTSHLKHFFQSNTKQSLCGNLDQNNVS